MKATLPRTGDRTSAVLGAVLVAIAVLGAAAFKARCGLPSGPEGDYLGWCYSDVGPLWFAERLNEGAAPYLEHAVEYPPLTGLWMWLAAWPADSLPSFFWWTMLLLVAAGAVTGALVGWELGPRAVLLLGLAPTLWLSGAVNWDMPSVALAVAAFVAHRRGHDGWAGIAVGLGTAAKLWPALLLPGIALAALRLRGPRAGGAAIVGALVAWSATNLPVAAAAPSGWLRFIELSRERVADWSSLWRVGANWLGVTPEVSTLNALVAATTATAVIGLLAWTLADDPPASWHLVALPVVTAFLLFGKVWSPQFSLWLLALLVFYRPGIGQMVAFAVVDVAVTITLFPYLGSAFDLDGAWPAWPFEVAVAVRAVVFAVLAVTLWRRAVAEIAGADAADGDGDDDGAGGGTGSRGRSPGADGSVGRRPLPTAAGATSAP